MGAIGATAFAVLAWGSIALVAAVFGYEAYAVVREYGDRSEGRGRGTDRQ
jgi:hypothetical protein